MPIDKWWDNSQAGDGEQVKGGWDNWSELEGSVFGLKLRKSV